MPLKMFVDIVTNCGNCSSHTQPHAPTCAVQIDEVHCHHLVIMLSHGRKVLVMRLHSMQWGSVNASSAGVWLHQMPLSMASFLQCFPSFAKVCTALHSDSAFTTPITGGPYGN